MKKLTLSFIILLASLTIQARDADLSENETCFALSFDGKKISHIVVYAGDYDSQADTVQTFNVRVFDYRSNLITGSTLDEQIVNKWDAEYNGSGKPYPAKHHIAFSQIKLNGQKISYDVKVDGLAKDIGGGKKILSGQSEVLIDGKKVAYQDVKTLNLCPNPSDRKEIAEVESLL